MLTIFNFVAAVIGYAIMFGFLMILLGIIREHLIGGLEALDFACWSKALAKQTNRWNVVPRRKRFKERVKRFWRDLLEYSGGIEPGTMQIRSGLKEGVVWQGRGNWTLPDGSKGPKFRGFYNLSEETSV